MTNTRARKHNLTAASWSANGSSVETADLRDAANHPYGANVFSVAVQKERLSPGTFERLSKTLASGEALDPTKLDIFREFVNSLDPDDPRSGSSGGSSG